MRPGALSAAPVSNCVDLLVVLPPPCSKVASGRALISMRVQSSVLIFVWVMDCFMGFAYDRTYLDHTEGLLHGSADLLQVMLHKLHDHEDNQFHI